MFVEEAMNLVGKYQANIEAEVDIGVVRDVRLRNIYICVDLIRNSAINFLRLSC